MPFQEPFNQEKNTLPSKSEPRNKKIKKIFLFLFLIFFIVGSAFFLNNFLNNNQTNNPFKKNDSEKDLSKIIISNNLNDNFKIIPKEKDGLEVETNSIYLLKSKEKLELTSLKKNLKISPKTDYDLKKISDQEWEIIPKKIMEPGTIIKFSLPVIVQGKSDQKEKNYSWAFQVKNDFKVINSIPRNQSAYVPINTGIEITFSHENYNDFEKYFEISPKIEGHFEKHRRTMVFVPKNNLEYGTVYTIKIKKGLGIKNSDNKLKKDYIFSFETDPKNQDYNSIYLWDTLIQTDSSQSPVIKVSVREIAKNNTFKTNLYKFNNWQDFFKSFQKINELPWWTRCQKSKVKINTEKLQLIKTYNLPIKKIDYQSFIEFPETYQNGFYLIEIENNKNKKYLWLEVNDIATYINITKTKTIIWTNSTVTQKPIKKAKIEIINTNKNYLTDEKGIASFNTADFYDPQKEKHYYFKILSGNNISLTPIHFSHDYLWRDPQKSSEYWVYLYKDRPMYQPNDTIKYWGLLKSRTAKKITGKIKIILSKSGYFDYYYRPIPIQEKEVKLSDLNTFEGEFKIKNLKAGYYQMQIKIDGKTVNTQYVDIKSYQKPAYQLTLIPDRKYAFSDEVIHLKARATFFEGTPVPKLKLKFENMGEKEYTKIFTTDDNGEVDINFIHKYKAPKPYLYYTEFPDYDYLSIKPVNGELSDIQAKTYVTIYKLKKYIETETKYPQKGKARLEITGKIRNLEKLNNPKEEKKGEDDKIAPNVKIEGTVKKITYTKKETGTKYDFINKKTYTTYTYKRKEEIVEHFSGFTDKNGKYVYERNVEPKTSYEIKLKWFDDSGKYNYKTVFLYYYDGYDVISNYFSNDYIDYHLKLEDEDEKTYNIGDKVLVKFLKNEELMPKGKNRYLFLQLQNGLKKFSISDTPEYDFIFQKEHIPNVYLGGVYFNGKNYIRTELDRYFGTKVKFNTDSKKLNIKIQTDKEKYKPGENVKLKLKVKDIHDKGIKTELNLNLIDEAFYALIDDKANPLSVIYADVKPGVFSQKTSHFNFNKFFTLDGGKGGCFTGDTKILMADKSEKRIDKIKIGDKILTYENPISKKYVKGTVFKVWVHKVNGYLIINDTIKVTPEHQIFSNNHFIDAGLLKIGDWILNKNRKRIIIKKIEKKDENVLVYNLGIKPQHTYFANGIYVHNDGKGGGPREFFTDAALFKTVKTNDNGEAKVEFKLPDNITSWRVTAQAISKNLDIGLNITKIPVSLPIFMNVVADKEYLKEDKPTIKLRAFGSGLNQNDNVNFFVEIPDLKEKSDILTGTAFKPLFYKLPSLSLGKHDLIYNLNSKKGNDSLKLPVNIIESRLETQSVIRDKLKTGYKIKKMNDLPHTIILSDTQKSEIYHHLKKLAYSWGDRVDQRITRTEAGKIIKKYYLSDFNTSNFDFSKYQYKGGITLLPYSSENLELSARIASLKSDYFDKKALTQYFLKKLNNRNSNQEEITLALYGLASLNQPVLLEIYSWLDEKDLNLNLKEKIYLAQALFNLGDKQKSEEIYNEILKNYTKSKDDLVFVKDKDSDNLDNIFKNTISMAVLANLLDKEEAEDFWNYVIKNQKLFGNFKNSEKVLDLEKIAYLKEEIQKLKPSPTKVKYNLNGQEKEINLAINSPYILNLNADLLKNINFESVEGNVNISIIYTSPLKKNTKTSNDKIALRRKYFVNGQETNHFKEGDIIEIRLYPTIKSKKLKGIYQITDILPTGLMFIGKYYDPFVSAFHCYSKRPYEYENQKVSFSIGKNWEKYNTVCKKDYLNYYVKVKNRGEYKAESAVIQNFLDSEIVNFSNEDMIYIGE